MKIKFENVERTLQHQAWVANNIYPTIPYEEFISAGHEIFVKCLGKYSKAKGSKFNTYFTASCKKYFKGMIQKKASKTPKVEFDPELQPNILSPEALVIFKDIMLNMPEDALTAVEIALTKPDICSRGDIRQQLLKTWGWGDKEVQSRISLAFKTVKKYLKNL